MAMENEEQQIPVDEMSIGTQVMGVEASREYIDDPNDLYMKNDDGQVIVAKAKISISYN